MTVQIYKSTDASAPVLSGQNGALISLLDACLVNGYGAKAAAGWTKSFAPNGNQAAYRLATAGATGFFLSVDDSGASATLAARVARVRGFETLTAFATGTGGFPTTTQLANGLHIYKSPTADATARAWILLADDKTFTLLTNPGSSSELSGYSILHFGDMFSLKTGDAYRAIIIGRASEGAAPGQNLPSEERFADLVALTAVATGHYMPRNYLGASQLAVNVGKHCGDNAKRGLIPYPNPADQSIDLAQLWVHEPLTNLGVLRGRLRGVWDFLHDPIAGVNDGDTFNGSGALAGKSFLVARPVGSLSTPVTAVRVLVLETSNTWETST
jgi:hypothetical protein